METAAGRRANGPLGPTWNLILFSLKFTHCPLPDYLEQKKFQKLSRTVGANFWRIQTFR